mmetsp:Transcript_19855/g.33355  ORF Transcript_19855/g.33355 Transcript_19855/m.33355 type:complete len:404 (-) Transcript_19855:1809-3020(-)
MAHERVGLPPARLGFPPIPLETIFEHRVQNLVRAGHPIRHMHVLRHLLEVADVHVVLHVRHERRLHAPRFQRHPVEPGEPRVGHDRLRALLAHAQPRFGVAIEQLADEVLGFFGNFPVKGDGGGEDLAADLGVVVAIEGRVADNHLVHQHPERPVVCAAIVARALQDLRRQVVRRPAQRVCVLIFFELFGEPEVHDLYVSFAVEQHVLQLEVAVDDAPLVHVVEPEEDGRRVKARAAFSEGGGVGEMREELPAEQRLEEHVNATFIPEGLDEVQHEGRVHLPEEEHLAFHLRLCARLHHVALVDGLHGVGHARDLVAHQVHQPERARTKHGHFLEVLHADVLLLLHTLHLLRVHRQHVLQVPEVLREVIALDGVALHAPHRCDVRGARLLFQQRLLSKKARLF